LHDLRAARRKFDMPAFASHREMNFADHPKDGAALFFRRPSTNVPSSLPKIRVCPCRRAISP